MNNQEMREETGEVNGNRLEAFLYELMRDVVPGGKIEALVMSAEKVKTEAQFTNGHLAKYAKLVAKRLTTPCKKCGNCDGTGQEETEGSHGRQGSIGCWPCGGTGWMEQ